MQKHGSYWQRFLHRNVHHTIIHIRAEKEKEEKEREEKVEESKLFGIEVDMIEWRYRAATGQGSWMGSNQWKCDTFLMLFEAIVRKTEFRAG